MPRRDPFTRYEVDEHGCWLWAGYRMPNGYGNTGRLVLGEKLAHRAFYRRFVGPIPEGKSLDHLCRNRGCVNPDHLEPVTPGENNRRGLRGFELTGKCRRGLHEMSDPANVYTADGVRRCRPCYLAWVRARRKAVAGSA